MTYVYEYVANGDNVKVEYCFSSVSDEIKVVEMWRVGEDEFGEVGTHFHRMNWMSKEGQESLMAELEEDMTDRMCMTGNYAPLDEEDHLASIGAQ